MPITDFQKKRYKLVPGQNYDVGPISRDGTFGNMMIRKMRENNKQIADRLPGIDGKVNDEYIESVTDFVNPAAGMIKNIKQVAKKHFNDADIVGSDIYVPIKDKEIKLDLWDEGKILSADTAELEKGSGAGSDIYPKIWDFTEDIGYKYQSGGLTPENEIRLSANMLKYMNKRKKDAPHVIMSRYQSGGIEDMPLTMDNAKGLADRFIDNLNNGMAIRSPIKGTMSDQDILDLTKITGPHYSMGKDTVTTLRNYLRDGILSVGSINLLMDEYDRQEAQ